MTESDLSIRPAREADLPELVALERAAFEHDPWTEAMLRGELGADGAFQLVAPAEGSNGRLAGYATFRLVADEAELLRIAVHPRARRRGLARKLLESGLEELERRSVRRCFLEVRCHNLPARALYAGLGFEQVGVRKGYYPDGSDGLVYRKACGLAQRKYAPTKNTP